MIKQTDVGSESRVVSCGGVEERPKAVDERFRVQNGEGGGGRGDVSGRPSSGGRGGRDEL